jgi:hypothetical protein
VPQSYCGVKKFVLFSLVFAAFDSYPTLYCDSYNSGSAGLSVLFQFDLDSCCSRLRFRCVFITAVPNTKLCAWGKEDSGGHVAFRGDPRIRFSTPASRVGPSCGPQDAQLTASQVRMRARRATARWKDQIAADISCYRARVKKYRDIGVVKTTTPGSWLFVVLFYMLLFPPWFLKYTFHSISKQCTRHAHDLLVHMPCASTHDNQGVDISTGYGPL